MNLEWKEDDGKIYLTAFDGELNVAKLVNEDCRWELFIDGSRTSELLLAETEEEAKEEAIYCLEYHLEEEINYCKELIESLKGLKGTNEDKESENQAEKLNVEEVQKKKIKVVYDVDDTLWGLNDIVYGKKMPGLTMQDATHFNCRDNPKLTKEQCKVITSLYEDESTFEECEFYDGIDHVFDLEKEGKADVWLTSSNFTNPVKCVKTKRLISEVKNINPDHIRMTVGNDHSREPGDVLIDDRAENVVDNIMEGNFKHYILINKPYNMRFDIQSKKVIRVNTVNYSHLT